MESQWFWDLGFHKKAHGFGVWFYENPMLGPWPTVRLSPVPLAGPAGIQPARDPDVPKGIWDLRTYWQRSQVASAASLQAQLMVRVCITGPHTDAFNWTSLNAICTGPQASRGCIIEITARPVNTSPERSLNGIQITPGSRFLDTFRYQMQIWPTLLKFSQPERAVCTA